MTDTGTSLILTKPSTCPMRDLTEVASSLDADASALLAMTPIVYTN